MSQVSKPHYPYGLTQATYAPFYIYKALKFGDATSPPIRILNADFKLHQFQQINQSLVCLTLSFINEQTKGNITGKLKVELPEDATVTGFEFERIESDPSPPNGGANRAPPPKRVWYPACPLAAKKAQEVVYREKAKGREVAAASQAVGNVFEIEVFPLPRSETMRCRLWWAQKGSSGCSVETLRHMFDLGPNATVKVEEIVSGNSGDGVVDMNNRCLMAELNGEMHFACYVPPANNDRIANAKKDAKNGIDIDGDIHVAESPGLAESPGSTKASVNSVSDSDVDQQGDIDIQDQEFDESHECSVKLVPTISATNDHEIASSKTTINPASQIDRIVIMWDSSQSQKFIDVHQRLAKLRALSKEVPNAVYDLWFFDVLTGKVASSVGGLYLLEISNLLENCIYDGATDLKNAVETILPEYGAQSGNNDEKKNEKTVCILFSDGQDSLALKDLIVPEVFLTNPFNRLYCVSGKGNSGSNTSLLQTLAHSGNGRLIEDIVMDSPPGEDIDSKDGVTHSSTDYSTSVENSVKINQLYADFILERSPVLMKIETNQNDDEFQGAGGAMEFHVTLDSPDLDEHEDFDLFRLIGADDVEGSDNDTRKFVCVPDHRLRGQGLDLGKDGLWITGVIGKESSVTEIVAVISDGRRVKFQLNKFNHGGEEKGGVDGNTMSDGMTNVSASPTSTVTSSDASSDASAASVGALKHLLGYLYAKSQYDQAQRDGARMGIRMDRMLLQIALEYGFCSPDASLVMLYDVVQFVDNDVVCPVFHPKYDEWSAKIEQDHAVKEAAKQAERDAKKLAQNGSLDEEKNNQTKNISGLENWPEGFGVGRAGNTNNQYGAGEEGKEKTTARWVLPLVTRLKEYMDKPADKKYWDRVDVVRRQEEQRKREQKEREGRIKREAQLRADWNDQQRRKEKRDEELKKKEETREGGGSSDHGWSGGRRVQQRMKEQQEELKKKKGTREGGWRDSIRCCSRRGESKGESRRDESSPNVIFGRAAGEGERELYYNQDFKRWTIRGKEDEIRRSLEMVSKSVPESRNVGTPASPFAAPNDSEYDTFCKYDEPRRGRDHSSSGSSSDRYGGRGSYGSSNSSFSDNSSSLDNSISLDRRDSVRGGLPEALRVGDRRPEILGGVGGGDAQPNGVSSTHPRSGERYDTGGSKGKGGSSRSVDRGDDVGIRRSYWADPSEDGYAPPVPGGYASSGGYGSPAPPSTGGVLPQPPPQPSFSPCEVRADTTGCLVPGSKGSVPVPPSKGVAPAPSSKGTAPTPPPSKGVGKSNNVAVKGGASVPSGRKEDLVDEHMLDRFSFKPSSRRQEMEKNENLPVVLSETMINICKQKLQKACKKEQKQQRLLASEENNGNKNQDLADENLSTHDGTNHVMKTYVTLRDGDVLQSYSTGCIAKSPSFYLYAAQTLLESGFLEEAFRICSNCLELDGLAVRSSQMLRSVGYVLLKIGTKQSCELALRVMERIKDLAPCEPQSYLDCGLARFRMVLEGHVVEGSGSSNGSCIAGKNEDNVVKSFLKLAVDDIVHVITHSWSGRYAEIEWPALILLHMVVKHMDRIDGYVWGRKKTIDSNAPYGSHVYPFHFGQTDEYVRIEDSDSVSKTVITSENVIEQMQNYFTGNWPEAILPAKLFRVPKFDLAVMVWLGWDTDKTDIDLHVHEPDGKQVYYGCRHSQCHKSDGYLSQDYTKGYGPEVYISRYPPSGKFHIKAKYYASHQNSTLTGATSAILWCMVKEKVNKETQGGVSADVGVSSEVFQGQEDLLQGQVDLLQGQEDLVQGQVDSVQGQNENERKHLSDREVVPKVLFDTVRLDTHKATMDVFALEIAKDGTGKGEMAKQHYIGIGDTGSWDLEDDEYLTLNGFKMSTNSESL